MVAASGLVFALYFGLPFRHIGDRSGWLALALMLTAVLGVMASQIRPIIEADDPRMRGLEALAVSIPLLIVSFATVDVLISKSAPDAYTEPLSRMDALYFSVSVLSTVGFGDISAVSQSSRTVVTIQMLMNILVLGAGVRIIVNAVEASREHAPDSSNTTPPNE